jgi:hypothetical protein
MLVVAPADDLMRPDKEGPRKDASILLETGLEGNRLVDLVFLSLHLLFHKQNLNINLIRF